MNQAELLEIVAKKSGHHKKDVESVLKATGETAQAALANGDEVVLLGIGKLSVSKRAARTGRNPKTGAALEIAAKRVPKFSASKALRDATAG